MAQNDYMGIPRGKIPWFPVIDENKCINCGECLDFCNNDVFEEGLKATVVAHPYNCVVGCTSCLKTCDADAIKFPSKDELIAWLHALRASRSSH